MGNDTKDTRKNRTIDAPRDFNPNPNETYNFLSINIAMRAADLTSRGATSEDRKDRNSKRTRERARAAMSTNVSKLLAETALSIAALMPAGKPEAPTDELRAQYRDILDSVTEDLQDRQRALYEFICSNPWKEIKAAFPPDLADEDAGIFFLSPAFFSRVYELLPDLKRKFTEYEKENGEQLTFEALVDGDGIQKEPLINKLLRAIEKEYEEEGPGAAAGQQIQKKGRPLRTMTKAGKVDLITIDRLAIPTLDDFLDALDFGTNKKGRAYLSSIEPDTMEFKNNHLYFKDSGNAVRAVELQDIQDNKPVSNIDLPLLQFYYSLMYRRYEDIVRDKYINGNAGEMDGTFNIYVPHLVEAFGLNPGGNNEKNVQSIKDGIATFQTTAGIVKHTNYKEASIYPVLLFMGYDATTNNISVNSPYLLYVAQEMYKESVIRCKIKNDKGEYVEVPKINKRGVPETKAANSHTMYLRSANEKNIEAWAIARRIIRGLEKRGGGADLDAYSISVKTLINDNPALKQRLKDNKNKNRVLQKCFSKAWKILREDTSLLEDYIDLELPDPLDTPTFTEINTRVYKFPHKGKKSAIKKKTAATERKQSKKAGNKRAK